MLKEYRAYLAHKIDWLERLQGELKHELVDNEDEDDHRRFYIIGQLFMLDKIIKELERDRKMPNSIRVFWKCPRRRSH